jgi:4-hydroxy-3-polyprenylbenzoate decarboxylase
MAWTKIVIVVDDDCDVHDTPAVLRRVAQCCHPGRDIETVHGPLDILDHAAPRLGAGMKIGLDATRKIAGDEVGGVSTTLPEWSAMSERARAAYLHQILEIEGVASAALPDALGFGWLFIAIEKTSAGQGQRTLDAVWSAVGSQDPGVPQWVIVVDAEVDLSDFDRVLFHWCAHCDASRDMQRWQSEDRSIARVGFDATAKVAGDARNGQPVRAWPPIIRMREDVLKQVAARWAEYGIDRVPRE